MRLGILFLESGPRNTSLQLMFFSASYQRHNGAVQDAQTQEGEQPIGRMGSTALHSLHVHHFGSRGELQAEPSDNEVKKIVNIDSSSHHTSVINALTCTHSDIATGIAQVCSAVCLNWYKASFVCVDALTNIWHFQNGK